MNSPLLWLLTLGPAALAAAAVFQGRLKPTGGARLASAAALLAVGMAVIAAVLCIRRGTCVTGTWGVAGVGAALYVDGLTAVLHGLVALVGAVVIRYSRHYLEGDPGQPRFMAWLCLTLAAVLLLILSGNLLQFAIAWVATSLGLHRLLLFYPERVSAILAARKKFLASRVGDLCLLGAMLLLYRTAGSLDYADLFAAARSWRDAGTPAAVDVVAVLLVATALLKSAQFPLHGWLTEVMEAPTPVSALLHAGIINAGGFLVLRFASIVSLSAPALDALLLTGMLTALFGSVVMLTQTAAKATLAYSTIAQMGFMMLQCGFGEFSAAALHIAAHSLYKAHAFLSAGSVIDLARASWSASPGGRPHPARLAIAIAIVTVVTMALAALHAPHFPVAWILHPGRLVLAAIVVMGLANLLANAIDERPSAFVIGRALALSTLVFTAYVALQIGAESLLHSALPPVRALRGPSGSITVGCVVAAFAAMTVLQNTLPYRAPGAASSAWYAHLANGLYVNTVANRLLLRWWPIAPPAAR